MNLPVRRSLPARANRQVSGELVDENLVLQLYEETGLDELLRKYAFHEGDMHLSEDIEVAFAHLAVGLTRAAYSQGEVDVELVRAGFDRVYASMNLAAGKARGLEIRKGLVSSLLVKSGVREPKYRGVVLPLDDKYWQEQFLSQFKEERMVQRLPEETEEVYLARYIHHCLRGFPWAYFTYAV